MRIVNGVVMGIALFVVAMSLSMLPMACTGEQFDGFRVAIGVANEQAQTADEAIAKLQEQKDALDVQIATMPPGEDRDKWELASAKIDEVLRDAQAVKDDIVVRLRSLEAAMANAQDTPDVIDAVVGEAAPLLPLPWGAALVATAGLLTSLWRAIKYRNDAKAGESVIAAVEAAKSPSGRVEFESKAAKLKLNEMTAAGKALVNKVQGK